MPKSPASDPQNIPILLAEIGEQHILLKMAHAQIAALREALVEAEKPKPAKRPARKS